jgi:tetratricopeptide (TPR) repeat protein
MGAAADLEAFVWSRIDSGDMRAAIDACERLNREHPDFASGWHTASQLAFRLRNPSMALDAIRQATRIEPENSTWLLQEARCLVKLGRVAPARAVAKRLAERELSSTYEYAGLGHVLTELGDRRRALECYESAAALSPEDSRQYYNMACLQRTLGDLNEAELNFDKTIELDPTDYEAWKLRSDLRTQTPERNHVAALEAVLEKGIDDKLGEANICYALAKELEDLGDPERSFTYLQRGATARRRQMQYHPDRDLETIATIQRVFSTDRLQMAADGHDSNEPIFILGMPRTGTTLVERILASHSEVQSAGELANFAVEMMRLIREKVAGRKLPRDALVELSADIDFTQLGEAYIESTRSATGGKRYFIDKLPLNYLYVGLIHLALPNAKIVHVQRDPMDTCYAVYKNLFADAYPFSYDLGELARYYVAYHGLMRHWHDALPGVMHRVRYEDLVSNVEGEARGLLEYCGLDWQPACLDFHKLDTVSMTASAAQVRRPMYQSSVGRWRDYEHQLQPVHDILQDAGIVD